MAITTRSGRGGVASTSNPRKVVIDDVLVQDDDEPRNDVQDVVWLCNAPATFQRCMMAIFTDMAEDFLEVFMDDFSVVWDSFDECLDNLDKLLTLWLRRALKKLKRDCLDNYWDEPYLFKICTGGVILRCVPEEEQLGILEACHSSPYGGHHGGARTATKVLSCGFYWTTLYKDASKLVK
ncbi:PREDICTED: uncharacterized protein LOC109208485 [Nicotiana attenuata]|uniref:uncharacterized protein LOC109208485 n=1 Tax=Nicotiana attenuata TaxID=49451 RepID=UPI00090546AD|nr:PREDICTED: uncharacterized protein LOC109208485 [Nicotiana attenuata]